MNDQTHSSSSNSHNHRGRRWRWSWAMLIAALAGICLVGILQSGSTRLLLLTTTTHTTTTTTSTSRQPPPQSHGDDETEDETVAAVVALHFRSILANVSTLMNDLDFDPATGHNMACGMFKCWIPSKSQPLYGYTLTQPYQKHNITSMTLGWAYAHALQQKYNNNHNDNHHHTSSSNTTHNTTAHADAAATSAAEITHFEHLYLRDLPPVVLSSFNNTSSNSNLTLLLNTALRALGKKTHKALYRDDNDYIVQVMRKMPNHSVLFCTRRDVVEFKRDILAPLHGWVQEQQHPQQQLVSQQQQQPQLAHNNNNHDALVFLQRVQENARQLQLLIQQERPLLHDFQFILDPTGRVWHLDLDRITSGFPCAPQMVHNRIQLFVQELTHLILDNNNSNNSNNNNNSNSNNSHINPSIL